VVQASVEKIALPGTGDRGGKRDILKTGKGRKLTARGLAHTPDGRYAGDVFLVDETRGVFIVAEGIDSHPHGEVAGGMAVRLLPGLLEPGIEREFDAAGLREIMQRAVLDINRRVLEKMVHERKLRGMGSTLVLAVVKNGAAHVLHLGDCRAYLLSTENRCCITRDHTLLNRMIDEGRLEPGGEHGLPNPDYITCFLGKQLRGMPGVETVELSHGDRLLLCAPGLHRTLTDEEIYEIAGSAEAPEGACSALAAETGKRSPGAAATMICVDYS